MAGILGAGTPVVAGLAGLALVAAVGGVWVLANAARRPAHQAKIGSLSDPKEQLVAVQSVAFEPYPFLTQSEADWLAVIDAAVEAADQGHRVMAQISLGRVIQPKSGRNTRDRKRAQASIRTKRLDYGVFDATGRLAVALVHIDGSRMQDRQMMRDAIRAEALARAKIPVIDILPGASDEDVAMRLYGILTGPARNATAAE